MTMTFSKYQGLGNDFILVDNRHFTEPILSVEQSVKLCNRNFGVGADGVIFAMSNNNNDDVSCDYIMRIYNSDGSEPEMCGNGVRCLTKFLSKLTDLNEHQTFRILTGAGVITATMLPSGEVKVDMGRPVMQTGRIPTTLPATSGDMAVNAGIDLLGRSFRVTAVSMGNPHAVVFVEGELDAMRNPPFELLGPALESHESFPQKTNAEFVQVLSRTHLRMKVWERGAGPTLACGTGACAVLVAAVLTGRADRQCVVSLPGGDLSIEWREADDRVHMTGPAVEVFRGAVDLSGLVDTKSG